MKAKTDLWLKNGKNSKNQKAAHIFHKNHFVCKTKF